MIRTAVILAAIPAAVFAQPAQQPANTTTNGGGRFFSRLVSPPARESREVAQFGPARNPNMQPQPQAQQPQQTPYNVQGASASTPAPEHTPTPRRARKTPKPDAETTESSAEPTPAAKKGKAGADSGDLDSMVKKLEKDKTKAQQEEDKLARAAEDATTAVNKLLKSANDGKYSEAVTYLTPELQKYFESEISVVNGSLKTVLDQLTRNGDMRSVTYANATVRGEGAVVEAELTYGNGTPERRTFDLINTKANGWRIVLPVGNGSHANAPAAAAASAPVAASTPAPAPMPVQTPAPTPAITPAPTAAVSTGATSGPAAVK
jgi:hypothetical protein